MPNYVPLVYRTSGGDQMQVASGGNVAVDSGGAVTFASGATLTLTGQAITSTGTVTGNAITSTGTVTGYQYVTSAVATASSGSTGILAYGVSRVYSCGVSTGHVYTMPAATVAGQEKYISAAEGAVSTAPTVVTLAGTLIRGLANITFSSGSSGSPQWIHLFAENTTNWIIAGMSTDVTIA